MDTLVIFVFVVNLFVLGVMVTIVRHHREIKGQLFFAESTLTVFRARVKDLEDTVSILIDRIDKLEKNTRKVNY